MEIHELRKRIDELVYEIEVLQKNEVLNAEHARTLAIVRTKLQESKMWAGKVLEAIGSPLPQQFRDACDKRNE